MTIDRDAAKVVGHGMLAMGVGYFIPVLLDWLFPDMATSLDGAGVGRAFVVVFLLSSLMLARFAFFIAGGLYVFIGLLLVIWRLPDEASHDA